MTPEENTITKPKKGITAGKIIGILAGVIILCAAIGAFGFYALYKGIQSGPQAESLKNVWHALDTNDITLAEQYASEQVVADLFTEDETGVSTAEYIQDSNIKVQITSISIENGLAKVFYNLSVDKNIDVLGDINYAELQEVAGVWTVTYIGVEEEPANTDY